MTDRTDTERLDWIEKHEPELWLYEPLEGDPEWEVHFRGGTFYGSSLRDAIDAAMAEGESDG